MTTTPLAPIDLHDPSVFARGIPQAAFAEMRNEPGLVWTPDHDEHGRGFWSVTRHDDLVEVSRDTTTYSSAVGHIQIYDIDEDALDARASMIDMDPPVHTRLRRIVSSAFTPRHVQAYRELVRLRVATALDALEKSAAGAATSDWVEVVAKPIPIAVICDLMGVPEADHAYMVELSDHLVAGTSSEPLEPTAYGNTTDLRLLPFNSPAAHAMSAYAVDLAHRRRRGTGSGDDLISSLLDAEIEGEGLTDEEFANFFRLMIFAGNETTRSSMAHLVLQMQQFPNAFARVAGDRSLLGSAADEVIRYSSPILYFRRTLTRPATLAGTDLAVGDKVVMWYASANFDDAVHDAPIDFQPDRSATPMHVAFGGGGAHFCLGASLARLELVELIDGLLDRPWRPTPVGEPEYVDSNFVNGIEHLAVSLDDLNPKPIGIS